MAVVIENKPVAPGFFLMRAEQENAARMGQFYMVRSWEHYPVLSRPISVYDADGDSVSLLYKVLGEGTQLLSRLRPGDGVTLDGPYGNGFPEAAGRVALVGGGVGIAPLYLAAKTLGALEAVCAVHLYLGFSGSAMLEEDFSAVCDKLIVDIGGYITDRIDTSTYDMVYTCGPEPMMRVLHKKCAATGTPLLVSAENRMACGLGACLVCSCKTANGNRKVCKDGPVFDSREVYFDA